MNVYSLLLLLYFANQQCSINADAADRSIVNNLTNPCEGLVFSKPHMHYWYSRLNVSIQELATKTNSTGNGSMTSALKELSKLMRDSFMQLTVDMNDVCSVAFTNDSFINTTNKFEKLMVFLNDLLAALPLNETEARSAVTWIQNQTAKTLQSIDQLLEICNLPKGDKQKAFLESVGKAFHDASENYTTDSWLAPTESEANLTATMKDTVVGIRQLCETYGIPNSSFDVDPSLESINWTNPTTIATANPTVEEATATNTAKLEVDLSVASDSWTKQLELTITSAPTSKGPSIYVDTSVTSWTQKPTTIATTNPIVEEIAATSTAKWTIGADEPTPRTTKSSAENWKIPAGNLCEGLLLFKPRIYNLVNKLAVITEPFKPIGTITLTLSSGAVDYPTNSIQLLLATAMQLFETFDECFRGFKELPDEDWGFENSFEGFDNMKLSLDSFKLVATKTFLAVANGTNRTEAKSVVSSMEKQIRLTTNAIDKLIEISTIEPYVAVVTFVKRIADSYMTVKVNVNSNDKFGRSIAVLAKELAVVESEVKKICGSTLDGSSEESMDKRDEETVTSQPISITTDKPISTTTITTATPILSTTSSAELTHPYKSFTFLLPLTLLLSSFVLGHKFG